MCQQSINMPIEGYNEMMHNLSVLDEIVELIQEYQFIERTDPGPKYVHESRIKGLVMDIEWALRKECGPTLEECPYAE